MFVLEGFGDDQPRGLDSVSSIHVQDCIPLRTIIDFYGRDLPRIFPDIKLMDLLNRFKQGHSHMALVQEVTCPEVC